MSLIEQPERFKKYITIRSNPVCKTGQWWLAEETGEPLYKAHIEGGPRGMRIIQDSYLAIPFETLAPFIVELGFHLSKEDMQRLERGKRNSLAPLTKEIEDNEQFERDFGDLIDEEVQKKIEIADPSYKKSSGIIVPREGKIRGKSDEGTGGGEP